MAVQREPFGSLFLLHCPSVVARMYRNVSKLQQKEIKLEASDKKSSTTSYARCYLAYKM
jgi:hypothetical protein